MSFDSLNHCRRVVTVHEAMIKRRRQVHHQSHGNLAIDHHRSFDGLVDTDDADFRQVDDRRRGNAAEFAEAGDRYGRSAEFILRCGIVSGSLGNASDFGSQPVNRMALGMATTGTFSPSGVCVAMPRCTASCRSKTLRSLS